MENLKNIEAREINISECQNIKGGWIQYIIAAIGYLLDDWAGFKQGYIDGSDAADKN